MHLFCSQVRASVLAATVLLSGCTSTLVRDDVKRTAGIGGHCSGSEWADDSSIAVLPVPVVAFVTPHIDLHHVSSEPYLNRCGPSTRVVNREVGVNRLACRPASHALSPLACGNGAQRESRGQQMSWPRDRDPHVSRIGRVNQPCPLTHKGE